MKLYLAAMFNTSMGLGTGQVWERMTEMQKLHRSKVKYLLESYHYFNSDKMVQLVRNGHEKIFLDSGAFSAFTKGVDIDLPGYCKFIQANADIIECASVLDSVGNPLKTFENQHAMEALGANPLPCFHYGEDERYLEHYLANYEYVTLGGMVPISTPQLLLWLDRLWNKYLVDGAGRPTNKIHGFGLTTIKLMERYPWYSVDSSSWVQISSFGNVIDPDYGIICLSSNSPNRKEQGRHFNTFTKLEQEALRERFFKVGYSVEELAESYMSRRCYCMQTFAELNRRFGDADKKFEITQPELFQ